MDAIFSNFSGVFLGFDYGLSPLPALLHSAAKSRALRASFRRLPSSGNVLLDRSLAPNVASPASIPILHANCFILRYLEYQFRPTFCPFIIPNLAHTHPSHPKTAAARLRGRKMVVRVAAEGHANYA